MEKERKLKFELNEPSNFNDLISRENKLKQKNLVDQITFNREDNNNNNNVELYKNERQKKMEDFRKMLDEQVNERKKMKEINQLLAQKEQKEDLYEMNQKFIEVHDAIDVQKQKREGIDGEYDNHINEVLEKMKEEFNKQKKNREEFQENVFALIEETCTKLASYNS